MDEPRVLVVGGEGAMGAWFVRFFEHLGWPVGVNDPAADPAEHVPDERVGEFDVVLVAVPIDRTVDRVAELAPRMEGGLLMDVTGVKVDPLRAMEAHASDGVELLGTHPMYGPSVRSMTGQTVILVKRRPGALTRRVERAFAEQGANLKETTARKHDEMMSVVQGLTHFTFIAFGSALRSLEFDIAESREFISPVYSIMLDFVGRIFANDPNLYAEMQRHQPVGDKQATFVDAAERLRELVADGDHPGIVDAMREAAQHYDDPVGAHSRTDKLVQAYVREYETLRSKRGEKVALVNTGSRKEDKPRHYGTIEGVDGRTLRLREGNELVELKIGNVTLLSDYLDDDPEADPGSVAEWKAARLGTRTDHVSVRLPRSADPAVVRELVADAHPDVHRAGLIDTYDGEQIPAGEISYTYEVETVEDGRVEAAVAAVRELLEGIGGTIR